MSSAPTAGEASLAAVVELPGGSVTLAPLEQLIGRRDQLIRDIGSERARSAGLRTQASSKFQEAAAILVAQPEKWSSSASSGELARIDELKGQVDAIDRQLSALASVGQRGFRGFWLRFRDQHERSQLVRRRDALTADIAQRLQYIGEHVAGPTVVEADTLLAAAVAGREEASSLEALTQTAQAECERLIAEIRRRQEAISKLGFDSLWTAAWLTQHDPPPIDAPVTMHRGESGWLNVPATLSRMTTRTRWVGGSHGVSFPIGHTGIRYRVGSYSGHPIQSSVLTDVDVGSLVLTSQRLIFIGRGRSVTIALQHIVHVEAYTDALAIFQDRRETPDFFRIGSPQYLLMYLNFAIERQR